MRAVVPDLSVEQYAERISDLWYRSTAAILEAAASCKQADDALTLLEKKRLIEHLPFSSSTFSKLVAIGGDRRITSPHVQRLLPSSFSSMYEVTLLSNDQLQRAVREKRLNPQSKRADISSWRDEKKSSSKRALYGSIYLSRDLSSGEFSELRDSLKALEARFSLAISVREASHQRRLNAWQRRFDLAVVRKCRKVLRRFKESHSRPDALKSYGPEEITITAGSTKEDILFVFESIGLDGSAYGEIEMSEMSTNPPPSFSYWGDKSVDELTDIRTTVRRKRLNVTDFTDVK